MFTFFIDHKNIKSFSHFFFLLLHALLEMKTNKLNIHNFTVCFITLMIYNLINRTRFGAEERSEKLLRLLIETRAQNIIKTLKPATIKIEA